MIQLPIHWSWFHRWSCRSLFGDVKANHNCWAARSRGEPSRENRTEPRWWDSYILVRKIKLLGWNIFENFETNLEFLVRLHTWNLETCFFVDQWEAGFDGGEPHEVNLTCRDQDDPGFRMGQFKMKSAWLNWPFFSDLILVECLWMFVTRFSF